jgi:enoyl-[acyl-carrier protein] reductase/trans-2-enoyl-CoA reductase (NAD+)
VSEILLNHLSGDDIDNTVVMGGEDWKMWMDALKAENLLAPGAQQLLILI